MLRAPYVLLADRKSAKESAARYLATEEEMDRRQVEEQLEHAIAEMLADGTFVEDRYGRLWPSHWLPAHNGEVFEPD